MNITEVRVKLMHHRTDRLRAFCSITIDNDFVVHDLRVIEGRKGLFVAMPSRKLSDNCPRCGAKNDLRAKFCGECSAKLEETRAAKPAGREKYHVDVAHPINTPCRELLQDTVLSAYKEEEKRAQEGLAPLHEYAPEAEVGELAEDYPEVEEAEELPGPPDVLTARIQNIELDVEEAEELAGPPDVLTARIQNIELDVEEAEELAGYREPEYEEPTAAPASNDQRAQPEVGGAEVEMGAPPQPAREPFEEASELGAEAPPAAEERGAGTAAGGAEPARDSDEAGSAEPKLRRTKREREPGGFNQGIL